MKKYILSTGVVMIAMGADVASYASTLFRERFVNKKGVDAPLSTIEWHCHYGSKGASVDEENVDVYGGVVVAAADFLATQYSNFSKEPVLVWTDKEDSFGSMEDISSVSVSFKNQSASIDFKIALKVKGHWYVSQKVLNGTGSFTPQNLDVKSSGWNGLTFEPDSSLKETGPAELPSKGEIEAVGLFDASGGPSGYGGRIRISEFIIKK